MCRVIWAFIWFWSLGSRLALLMLEGVILRGLSEWGVLVGPS